MGTAKNGTSRHYWQSHLAPLKNLRSVVRRNPLISQQFLSLRAMARYLSMYCS